jgi:hypothetical protein
MEVLDSPRQPVDPLVVSGSFRTTSIAWSKWVAAEEGELPRRASHPDDELRLTAALCGAAWSSPILAAP